MICSLRVRLRSVQKLNQSSSTLSLTALTIYSGNNTRRREVDRRRRRRRRKKYTRGLYP